MDIMDEKISLNGKWKYFVDENKNGMELGYWKSNYKDSSWKVMDIPSNWYLNGLDYNGVVWFRYEFDLEYSNDDIIIIYFNGIDYHAKIWINENYLGAHEGYFSNFNFNISGKVLKEKNIIIIRCCAPHDLGFPFEKKLFKGGLIHWDCRPGSVTLQGQEKGSGGIWQPIFIKTSKKVEIEDIRVSPIIKDDDVSALVDLNLINNDNSNLDILIKLTIIPFNFEGETEKCEEKIVLNVKKNELNFKIKFKDPQLWWTWDYGNPNLYTLKIETFYDNKLINNEETKFGLRILEEKEDSWYLNGIPIFLKGSCYFSSCWMSEMTMEKFEKDIRLVKEANMNILRNGYHIEPQDFYDVCDREGILIWQDFPLLWDYDISQSRIKEACRQAKEMVMQFYNHPSIVIWCCHCEPLSDSQIKLDLSLRQTIQKYEKSNRKILLKASHEDHPFVGWYFSTYYNFLTLPGRRNPNEFGAQALPNENSKFWSDMGRENWWPINKEWVYRDFQRVLMFYLTDIFYETKGGITLKQFIKLSQSYQARLLKFGLETFRRGKGKIHGSILFTFNDAWPSITWSIVDYYRNPKLGFYSVKKAFQPLLCSIELPTVPVPNIPPIQLSIINISEILIAPLKALTWNEYFTQGSIIKANLWIINDYNYSINNAILKWELIKNDQSFFSQRFRLTIPSSCSIFIKTIKFKFKDDLEFGEYLIKTTILDNKGKVISNNDFTIFLCSKWKMIKKAIFRFLNVYKNHIFAILGMEINIKMIINAIRGKYKKLAEKSYCLE